MISSLAYNSSSNEVGGSIVLFEHARYFGKYQNYSIIPGQLGEVPYVGNDFNDLASSALIIRRFPNETTPVSLSTLVPHSAITDIVNARPRLARPVTLPSPGTCGRLVVHRTTGILMMSIALSSTSMYPSTCIPRGLGPITTRRFASSFTSTWIRAESSKDTSRTGVITSKAARFRERWPLDSEAPFPLPSRRSTLLCHELLIWQTWAHRTHMCTTCQAGSRCRKCFR